MDRINLEEPRFTQAEAVQLVPGLTVRTLQNWAQRGLLDELDEVNPGKGAVRLYSSLGVVALRLMRILVDLHISPRAARKLVDEIAHAVLELHSSYPTREEGGRLSWVIPVSTAQSLRAAYITTDRSGEYRIRIQQGYLDTASTTTNPNAYIVAQLDLLCLTAFNRIYTFIAEKSKKKN
jgi:DNA-binding transcriptional MerR regulator